MPRKYQDQVLPHYLAATDHRQQPFKGAVSRYSVIFCAFFARAKIGDCSRKCRGHQTMTARSAARTASPASRENVFFSSNCRFSRPCLTPPLFFPTQNGCQKITDYRDTAALSKIAFIYSHTEISESADYVVTAQEKSEQKVFSKVANGKKNNGLSKETIQRTCARYWLGHLPT